MGDGVIETIERFYLRKASYNEYSIENNKLPIWEVLRMKATLVDENDDA